jgi:hypothetical protein
MQIYPFHQPLILTDQIFSLYGGKGTGSFTSAQLQIAYQQAEQQTVAYIGTFLLPTIVTGTFVTVQTATQRIATDYGYVNRILDVVVKTEKITYSGGCELINSRGGAFIYEDTFGYVDVYKLQTIYGINYNPYPYGGYMPISSNTPYQFQIVYEAGLPTGTSTLPMMLQAMTMAAQIHLNEMFPGVVGMNEGTGDVGIQEFESFGYRERRTAHSLRRTAFGNSAVANKVASLIDASVKKCRRALKVS